MRLSDDVRTDILTIILCGIRNICSFVSRWFFVREWMFQDKFYAIICLKTSQNIKSNVFIKVFGKVVLESKEAVLQPERMHLKLDTVFCLEKCILLGYIDVGDEMCWR